jgi:hypothetical protein
MFCESALDRETAETQEKICCSTYKLATRQKCQMMKNETDSTNLVFTIV